MIIHKLNRIAKKILLKKKSHVIDEISLFKEWYSLFNDNRKYSIIIFSKDRPIQLYALLESIDNYSKTKCTIDVLSFYSSDQIQASYDNLKNIVLKKNENIFFHNQQNNQSFKTDLIQLLNQRSESRIIFLVDDIIFIRKFDLLDFNDFDLRKNVPSLRLGKKINFSYTMQTQMEVPQFEYENKFLRWKWNVGGIDWKYPLSVDGNIFLRSEILQIIKKIDFHSPNTLEGELQKYIDLYKNRNGICYEMPRLINIPCNKVQNDCNNLYGDVGTDYLLKKWNDKYEIDYKQYENYISNSVHDELDIKYKKMDIE